MNKLIKIFAFWSVFLMGATSFAASEEDPGVFTGEYKQGIPLGDLSGNQDRKSVV